MTRPYLPAFASALLMVGCSSSPDTTTMTATLTVNNFLSWCSLAVTSPANTTLPNGATAASNAITLPVNTVVTLHAEPTSGFAWATSTAQGGWSGSLDSGTDRLSKTISVTLDASKSVNVCCPFPNGTGCT